MPELYGNPIVANCAVEFFLTYDNEIPTPNKHSMVIKNNVGGKNMNRYLPFWLLKYNPRLLEAAVLHIQREHNFRMNSVSVGSY
jgi:hypothetical protein